MDDAPALPACGLYRTVRAVAGVPPGRLVYFHNHGNPGPGVYLPKGWTLNRAVFADEGFALLDPTEAAYLEPLLPEGLYRVTETFYCCEACCRAFETDLLVQLGYDGEATPILFVPELSPTGLAFPEVGQPLDEARLAKLAPLVVPEAEVPEGLAN